MQKQFPGLDLDILEGYISDRYTEILEELAWERLDKLGMVQTIAPYQTGTVTVAFATQAVTLTGGAWDPTMTGRFLQVAGDSSYYTFTYTGPTTGTIGRPDGRGLYDLPERLPGCDRLPHPRR
jgi:hypothetical protein